MLTLVKVLGHSMHPTLKSGDYVLGCTFKRRLRVSDLVIVHHPVYGRIVKRVQAISPDKGIYIAGDSPLSTPAEMIGWVPFESVVAKILILISRSGVSIANKNKNILVSSSPSP